MSHPTVDILGNIYVNAQAGVKIPVVDQDSTGTQIDISAETWTFKMPNLTKELEPNPADAKGKLLVITPAEAELLATGGPTPFIVTDANGDIRWEAELRRRGW